MNTSNLPHRLPFAVLMTGKWIDINISDIDESVFNYLNRYKFKYIDSSEEEEHMFPINQIWDDISHSKDKPHQLIMDTILHLSRLASENEAAYVRFIKH